MKKSEKRRETLKTLIIALLFTLVILMVCLHFEALRRRNESANGADRENDFSLRSPVSLNVDTLTDEMLIPGEIAFKDATGNTFAITSGKDYMEEIYSLLGNNISFLLGSGCSAVSDSSESFTNAVRSDSFIYVRYHSSLPASLLYMNALEVAASESASLGEKTSSVSVVEMIIFPESTAEGSAFGFTRSITGEVFKFIVKSTPDTKITEINDLEIYKEAGAMISASFYGGEPKSNILTTTLIFDDAAAKPKLTFSKGIDGLSENSELQSAFAELLDINPNKTGSYFDGEIGGTVYMATHGTLTFTDTGIIYSTENNTDGIPLSLFSGKDYDSQHSMYECIAAAESIASSLLEINSEAMDDAELIITDLFRSGNMLTLKFGYFYDNIPISDSGSAIVAELTSNKLTGLKYYPASITAKRTELQKPLPASWIVQIAENVSDENSFNTLIYKYVKNENGDYTAEWNPVRISG